MFENPMLLKQISSKIFVIGSQEDTSTFSQFVQDNPSGLKNKIPEVIGISKIANSTLTQDLKSLLPRFSKSETHNPILVIHSKWPQSLAWNCWMPKEVDKIGVYLKRVTGDFSQTTFVLGETGEVTQVRKGIAEKSHDGWGFAGALWITPDLIPSLPDHGLWEWASEQKILLGQPMGGPYESLGKIPQVNSPKPCLFLDRDGILIRDTGYPHEIEKVEILEAGLDLIRWAKSKGWLAIVISNQAGIAKGIFGQSQYEVFTKHLAKQFSARGADVDAWFHCPFEESGKVTDWALQSILRKPLPGMVLQAMEKFPIDLTKSLMVGDKPTDKLWHLPLRTLLLKGDYPIPESETYEVHRTLGEIKQALDQA